MYGSTSTGGKGEGEEKRLLAGDASSASASASSASASGSPRPVRFSNDDSDKPEPTLTDFVEYVSEHESLMGAKAAGAGAGAGAGSGSGKAGAAGKAESPEARNARHKLIKATLICLLFMCFEIAGGYMAGSLAIMTDAAHLMSDVAGFMISLFALYLSNRKATARLSFGFKRAEIVGAVLSVMLIWFLTGVLLWEAIIRTRGILSGSREEAVDGRIMFVVALFGLGCNMTLLFVLGHDHSHGPGADHGHSHSHSHGAAALAPREEVEKAHGHSHGSHGSHDSHSSNGDSGSGSGSGSGSNTHRDEETGHGHSHGSSEGGGNDGGSNGHGHGHGHGAVEKSSSSAPKQHQRKQQESINISAAYIHAIGDLIQSVGVCIAGALIWAYPYPEYRYTQLADPAATFLFSLLVLYSTYDILKTSINVLMEGVPAGIDPKGVALALMAIPGVKGVHHLHIWSLTVGEPSLSVHLVVMPGQGMEEVLQRAQHVLRGCHIDHSTVQIEKLSDRDVCVDADCAGGSPCDQYAIACHEDGNCYDHA